MPPVLPPRLASAGFALALLVIAGAASAAPQAPAAPTATGEPEAVTEPEAPKVPTEPGAPAETETSAEPPPGAPVATQEPDASSEETLGDEDFAKSFVGKTYEGELEIDGWTDLGGGLVSPRIFVHQYQRADGTFLVITSRELAKATGNAPASLVVADALIVKPPKGGAEFTISCMQGRDEMLRFMGVAKGSSDKEWWTDVRQAWEIAVGTGEISTVKAKGVRCTNVSWGQ